MDMEYISELLQNLLLAILPVLAAQGVAILLTVYKQKRAELNQTQQYILDFGVSMAVKAAEQLYESGQGAEKKDHALKSLEAWTKQYGLTIDAHVLEAAIEAAVFDQFGSELLPQG